MRTATVSNKRPKLVILRAKLPLDILKSHQEAYMSHMLNILLPKYYPQIDIEVKVLEETKKSVYVEAPIGQRGWLEKADVINAWPLEKLQEFLAAKQ